MMAPPELSCTPASSHSSRELLPPYYSMLRAWLAASARVAATARAGDPTCLSLVNYNGGTRAELLRDADGIFSGGGLPYITLQRPGATASR
jgi:hypothetical protein